MQARAAGTGPLKEHSPFPGPGPRKAMVMAKRRAGDQMEEVVGRTNSPLGVQPFAPRFCVRWGERIARRRGGVSDKRRGRERRMGWMKGLRKKV